MRYMIGSQMGWIAVPFIFVVGAAYVWIVDRLLSRSTRATVSDVTTTAKISKAA